MILCFLWQFKWNFSVFHEGGRKLNIISLAINYKMMKHWFDWPRLSVPPFLLHRIVFNLHDRVFSNLKSLFLPPQQCSNCNHCNLINFRKKQSCDPKLLIDNFWKFSRYKCTWTANNRVSNYRSVCFKYGMEFSI